MSHSNRSHTPTGIEELYREEWARLVASLARRFRDLDVAEEAASEAFLAAVEHWSDGAPPSPGGWLMTTATRRAIDRIRRDTRRTEKYAAMLPTMIHTTGQLSPDVEDADDTGPVEDDRLRLMFTCCHPALARESQVALTLRLVGGLTVGEIARGLMKSETALGQRITRAKAKVASAHIPYTVPSEEDLPERLDAVLAVLYLTFNEAYLPGGDQAPRSDLSGEAIRLTRLLHQLLPDQPEATGLLALMLLTDSRRLSRVSADGELVTLAEQDRGGWNRLLIEEGHTLVRSLIAGGMAPGRYQLQAAINAVHCYAPDVRDTDWEQLSTLYDHLFAVDPTPVVALNRAVVRAELDGPAVALAEVDGLDLHGYHAWHATRADLLRRLGRSAAARSAYDTAIELAANRPEIRYLERRRASLATAP
jgi:RNA polymerase sigma-70 factor, ECF subfamily